VNFFTLKFTDGQLIILDQTRLPQEVSYLQLSDYREVIEAIKTLRVRGAPAIGLAAAYAAVLAAGQSSDFDQFAGCLDEIKTARPTAINLSWAIDQIKELAEDHRVRGMNYIRELVLAKALALHEEDARMCERIGGYGAELIHNGMGILTHCNAGALATGGKGTALAIIYTAAEQGTSVTVYVDETRPLLQGARLTAWELQQAGISVVLNTDSMAASLMQAGQIHCIITGADRVAANFDVINKIGTYGLAVLAKHHGIPFYVAIPSSTFDSALPTGAQAVIEYRAAEEITRWAGRPIAPEGIGVYSPAFDVTPHQLLPALITDNGIIWPNC